MNDDRHDEIARSRALLSDAYQKHWLELDRETSGMLFFSYDTVEEVKSWRLAWHDIHLLSSNFNELVNALNAWNHRLRSWSAWNRVLASISDEADRWEVRSEFVEPLVFFCLHQPTSTWDRLIRFATQVVHAGNQRVIAGYRDVLAEDAKVFKRLQQNHKKPHAAFLRREEAEAQFKDKSSGWHEAGALMTHFQQLDTDEYRDVTGDWRNRAAHGISQHFEFGEVERVTRRVGFAETKVEGHGGVEFKEDRTRKSVSYVFGGCDALKLDDVLKANQSQFEVAMRAVGACEKLLREVGERVGCTT
jgi:hypothetical protein